ncbi:Protein of unknown function [Anaerovirgula multivorans]|uniref:DUF2680 domain-containing protein n=1 Tax=Anaerovirgula multivorans TaxID=312168 RepID=A0A239G468_9FIRM|nr:DUF2680 domain-containing protein [Anaerovirgula multivorans]SNS63969.1 Protein of unknown function [Anaerovirgula multivorans]
MKKMIALGVVMVLVLGLGMVAYAESNNEVPQWFNDMMTWRKGQVQESLEAGEITEEEAATWNEHFDQMEEYHTENGFQMGRGFGACHGNNDSGRGLSLGRGIGNGMRGMMGGF